MCDDEQVRMSKGSEFRTEGAVMSHAQCLY